MVFWHSDGCRGVELLGRSVKVEKVWEVDGGLIQSISFLTYPVCASGRVSRMTISVDSPTEWMCTCMTGPFVLSDGHADRSEPCAAAVDGHHDLAARDILPADPRCHATAGGGLHRAAVRHPPHHRIHGHSSAAGWRGQQRERGGGDGRVRHGALRIEGESHGGGLPSPCQSGCRCHGIQQQCAGKDWVCSVLKEARTNTHTHTLTHTYTTHTSRTQKWQKRYSLHKPLKGDLRWRSIPGPVNKLWPQASA